MWYLGGRGGLDFGIGLSVCGIYSIIFVCPAAVKREGGGSRLLDE